MIADERCPDCDASWVDTMQPCPGCGLTIEAVAERLAGRARDRAAFARMDERLGIHRVDRSAS